MTDPSVAITEPTEIPLHVQVGRLLGAKIKYRNAHSLHSVCDCMLYESGTGYSAFPMPFAKDRPHLDWMQVRREEDGDITWRRATRYDVRWQATGPLIERFGIKLYVARYLGSTPEEWGALYPGDGYRLAENATWKGLGPTPLVAVCNLIINLPPNAFTKS